MLNWNRKRTAAGALGLTHCRDVPAWGQSREEALEALKEAAQAYLEVLVEKGQQIPETETVQTVDAPLVAVTL